MTHHLKAWPHYFERVATGQKTLEIRHEDIRIFNPGDRLVLEEWDPDTATFSGNTVTLQVTHVLRDAPFVPPGYAALSIRRWPDTLSADAPRITEQDLDAWWEEGGDEVRMFVTEIRRLRSALADIRDSDCQDSETELCWCYDKADQALRDLL